MMNQVLHKNAQDLFEIDANLNRLVKKIELLDYINPLNIESEKKKFFAAKFNYKPEFKYRKLKFNGYKLHRLFFSQRLERIENEEVRQLYEDIIYEYSGLIECIETIGMGRKFYFNSLKSFGTPTEKDVDNAKFILRFDEKDFSQHHDMKARYSAEDAKAYFETVSQRYNFDLNIKFSTNISAAAMVQNSSKTLILKKNYSFSKNQLKVLANHEIGVHLVTTFNGFDQPLKIFSNGLPNNVETQEGLAVFSEYMSNCLTLSRLKELAYRTIAVDSLTKGYNFLDTFDLLYNQYKLDKEKAFSITLRVHRGGGFTKDYLYLSGLRNIYQYTKTGNDLDVLLTGKVSIEYINVIKKLQQMGLAKPSKYVTDVFLKTDEVSKDLDFILSGLK